jgi:ketosteroid isomerase-like protein
MNDLTERLTNEWNRILREGPLNHPNHQIVREFFTALSSGALPQHLFTDDMIVWTITSGNSTRVKYQHGVKVLQSLFPDGLHYTVDSLTAEADRVAAEVQARGKLVNGEHYHNTYVFLFRIRDARIARVAEYFNALVVRDKLAPLMKAAVNSGERPKSD